MYCLNFPIMIGMAVLAKPLVLVLLSDKWINMHLPLSILCFAYIFIPLMMMLSIWYFIYRKKKLNSIGSSTLINQLIPYSSQRKRIIKNIHHF